MATNKDGKPSDEIFLQYDSDMKTRGYYLEGTGQEKEVAPAVIVADEEGNVTKWWSWKSLFSDDPDFDKKVSVKKSILSKHFLKTCFAKKGSKTFRF